MGFVDDGELERYFCVRENRFRDFRNVGGDSTDSIGAGLSLKSISLNKSYMIRFFVKLKKKKIIKIRLFEQEKKHDSKSRLFKVDLGRIFVTYLFKIFIIRFFFLHSIRQV